MEDFLWRARPWAATLVQHNWPIMVCSVLVVWAGVRAYLRPTRRALLLLYGLLVLALAFEYQKHGVEVAAGTTAYLFSTYANPGLRRASQFALVGVLPVALYLSGLALLALSLVPRRSGSRADAGAARSAPTGGFAAAGSKRDSAGGATDS